MARATVVYVFTCLAKGCSWWHEGSKYGRGLRCPQHRGMTVRAQAGKR